MNISKVLIALWPIRCSIKLQNQTTKHNAVTVWVLFCFVFFFWLILFPSTINIQKYSSVHGFCSRTIRLDVKAKRKLSVPRYNDPSLFAEGNLFGLILYYQLLLCRHPVVKKSKRQAFNIENANIPVDNS